MSLADTPIATYRAQFAPDWRFGDAAALADYFAALGISHLYCSPVLEARAGSTHGYDVTDPLRIRGELGGDEEFERLCRCLHDRSLGIVLDIVPNHMAADHGNRWWWDVLKHGRDSKYAGYFDINWDAGGGKVVLPVLGQSLDDVLAAGQLALDDSGGEPVIRYYDKRFPVAPGSAESHHEQTGLRGVLGSQHYRLMYWRDGLKAINYRRFFDVSDLISMRVEDPQVFDASHALILDMVRDGHVQGLRIDHIDGLFDPREYLVRLREHFDLAAGAPRYLIVEKILADDEPLPADWPVNGSSGYEFLAHANRVFVDVEGAGVIEADAQQRLGAAPAFEAAAREAKRYVIGELFSAELARLTALLADTAAAAGRTVARDALQNAIVETTAAMEVYRTYITGGVPSAEDRRRITHALDTASAYAHGSADWSTAVELLRHALLDPPSESAEAWRSGPRGRFVLAWQQFTSPVMAKGVEDTALYRRITLASLNDVGCEPDQLPADPVGAFHEFCQRRLASHPGSLNTTSTHDTKRGEDTRLRISALSETPREYLSHLDRWFQWHAPMRAVLPDGPAPSPTDEVVIYQCALALWPAGGDDTGEAMEALEARLGDYLVKAAREAKLRSTWHEPNEQYEEALRHFIHSLIRGREGGRFRDDCEPLRKRMAACAMTHSLAQVVLKCAAPGIPDFYRGAELWDLSLVDPDNRRPVDFQQRQAMLEEITRRWSTDPDALVLDLMEDWYSGAVKLFTIFRALACRNRRPDLFLRGGYLPLRASGEMAGRVLAFARRLDDEWAVAIVPCRRGGEQVWDTFVHLPAEAPSAWHNAFSGAGGPALSASGGQLSVEAAFADFPVALLEPA